MSGPEGFLSRWSRRKRAADEADATAGQPPAPGIGPDGDPEPAQSEAASVPGPEGKPETKEEKEEPAFDLSKLPPIESITAETDIRAFLAPGVPPALTQAALRRAWVVDPKIRDFIEIAENQWDFTVPGGAPGFDLSPPTGDIARMIEEILPTPRPPEAPHEAPATADAPPPAVTAPPSPELVSVRTSESSPPAVGHESSPQAEAERATVVAQRDPDDAASQNDGATQKEITRISRRSHGRALPR